MTTAQTARPADPAEGAGGSVAQLEDDLRRGVLSVLGVAFGVLGFIAAGVFLVLPNGELSAIVLCAGSVLAFGVTWLARRVSLNGAAALMSGLFWVVLVVEPATTGDLSTNAFFMGLLAAFMAVSFSQRLLWLALPVPMASVALLALVTEPARTPPVSWLESMATGTLLTLATSSAVGIVLWQAGRQLIAEALADRTVRRNIESLRQTNANLERTVAERTAHLVVALEERRAAAEALRRWTNTDSLTGLLNRRGLDDQTSALSISPVPHRAAIVIDLDKFKSVNDRFSHQVGDEVLQRLAEILTELTPDDAVVARFGGEEFVILIEDITAAPALAERLRASIAEEDWSWLTADLTVTASVGLSATDNQAGGQHQTVSDAVLRAFQAMATAKALGGNQISRH